MNCMKCGRETAAEQIFCQECLLDMEKYPVKPGTTVQLPKQREASTPRKNSKRRNLSTEEQLKWLKRRVRILTVLLFLALVLIAALAYPAAEYFLEDHFRPGQNYSSIVIPTTPAGTATETTG